MRKRFDIWTWAGFFTAAVLGTLGHFAYDWSGKSLPVGAFCAVNESTWEHMKLLFFPVLLFTAVQLCLRWESGLLAARAVSTTAGGSFCSGNSTKGSQRVTCVPRETTRMMMSACTFVNRTACSSLPAKQPKSAP